MPAPLPLRVFAAGSLRHVLPRMLEASAILPVPEATFGPAGLLRERIEGGDMPDLFLSANLGHPAALATGRPGARVLPFARNTLVAVAQPSMGLTTEGFLDGLLAEGVRLGTSTPGADPSGDYAHELFDKAEALRPGSGARLRARARALVGGREDPAVQPGDNPARAFLAGERVDVFLSYASNARALSREFDVVVPPRDMAVTATYGLVVLSSRPNADALAGFITTSPACRALLDAAGFLGVTG